MLYLQGEWAASPFFLLVSVKNSKSCQWNKDITSPEGIPKGACKKEITGMTLFSLHLTTPETIFEGVSPPTAVFLLMTHKIPHESDTICSRKPAAKWNYTFGAQKKERKKIQTQQDNLLLVVISEVVEHETDNAWCKNKGDGCSQTLCRREYERVLLPRILLLLCCSLYRCSHNFLHVDRKSSTSFKNDVIVCVVRIRKENFQCVSYVAKLFPNALKGLLIKSMTKFRQNFAALFLPLI